MGHNLHTDTLISLDHSTNTHRTTVCFNKNSRELQQTYYNSSNVLLFDLRIHSNDHLEPTSVQFDDIESNTRLIYTNDVLTRHAIDNTKAIVFCKKPTFPRRLVSFELSRNLSDYTVSIASLASLSYT